MTFDGTNKMIAQSQSILYDGKAIDQRIIMDLQ